MFNQGGGFTASNMETADMMGTPISQLKEQDDNLQQVNYDRIRQMQDFMGNSTQRDSGNMEELANNMNQDLDDIDNYTPDDNIQIQQLQQLQQFKNLQEQISSDRLHKKRKKNSKRKNKNIVAVPDIVIEGIVLVAVYVFLSSDKAKELITKYIGIGVDGEVKIGVIVAYAIILMMIYLITKTIVVKIKNRYV